ncbi:uncharacterized protein PSANT_03841 [Moesziomyces antarcticus]|uniref:Uncharacterized protein n=1 Tax=Pseudozyma antarctica TaxID=84753 RepID=A0A5C3FQS6_PSEA2|nr:uncharacterized protein PSANT_03841 [Moesziomyces antarcticus]
MAKGSVPEGRRRPGATLRFRSGLHRSGSATEASSYRQGTGIPAGLRKFANSVKDSGSAFVAWLRALFGKDDEVPERRCNSGAGYNGSVCCGEERRGHGQMV